MGYETDHEWEGTAAKPKREAGCSAPLCSQFGEERKALLSKLSGMHDQFCHCMGRHPDQLLLTPYTAGVLGWEEGFRTPFYATVTDTGEIQDIFTANDPGDAR